MELDYKMKWVYIPKVLDVLRDQPFLGIIPFFLSDILKKKGCHMLAPFLTILYFRCITQAIGVGPPKAMGGRPGS